MGRSPYELCAAPELLARLHPRLRAYFGAIPPGHVGRGEGVFRVVGTPRRWLHPLLALFARDAVMFPVWERDVPFTVENRPARVGRGSPTGLEARPTSAPPARPAAGHVGSAQPKSSRTAEVRGADRFRRWEGERHHGPAGSTVAHGSVAVRAARTFRFAGGSRTMVDAITAEPDGAGGYELTDHLGHRGRISAALRVDVDDGGALRLVSTRVTFRALGRGWSLPAVIAPQVRLEERFDDEADRQRVSLVLSAPIIGTLYRYEGAFTYSVVRDERES
jgi:hypothetical protein